MKNVDVAQLFQAVQNASVMMQVLPTGHSRNQHGFRTEMASLSDDSIWYFYVEGEWYRPNETRFYLLTPYLNGGLTVDDITTAIQTSWRMRGDVVKPTLSFHKETNLLIAVGSDTGLNTIEAVLKALDRGNATERLPSKVTDDQKTKQ